MSIILFLVVLFFLVLVHELGHFMVAKWTKMRVDEFGIGFPPRVFSIKKGETLYALNLLPIGGYVRIFGENGTEELDEINQKDKARAFGSRPRHYQAAVLSAGVIMNILTAWIIFFAIAMIGTPTMVEEGTADNADLIVANILMDSPAEAAAIPLGAKITGVSADNESLETFTPSAFTAFIGSHTDDTITITYEDGKKNGSAELTPEAGVLETDPNRQLIGLAPALVSTVQQGPLEALKTATTRTFGGLYSITLGLAGLITSIGTLSADLDSVTGPIGIAGMVGDAAEFGVVTLLAFTAFISLNLAIINLLPIPALDGGRLLFVAIEAIIRRPIDPKWMGRVNLTGFTLLIMLMIAVTYGDIVRLI